MPNSLRIQKGTTMKKLTALTILIGILLGYTLTKVVDSLIESAMAQDALSIATPKSGIAWDAPQVNADDSPYDDHSHYIIAISDIGEDLNSGGSPLITAQSDCSESACELAIRDMTATLPDAQYRAWVRAVDHAGNESVWSAPLDFLYNRTVPSAPMGVRIVTTTTITTTTTVIPPGE